MKPTKAELKRAREMSEVSWELANKCLDVLPPSDLSLCGLTLMHLVAVWLRAVDEEKRGATYMHWLDMLHQHLDQGEVLHIKSIVEPIEGQSEMVH